jgi:hypothetical protein
MSSRIRTHIRSNVIGYIALFLVVTGGTAQALQGRNTVFSDDIVNQEVKTADIDTRAVTSNRLAANSVKAGTVVNDSLTGLDIRNLTGDDVAGDSLTGANITSLTGADVTDGSLGGADVGGNSITGSEVNEGTLGEVPSATIGGTGRSNTTGGYCNPESTGFATCTYTTVQLPQQTRTLVIGSIRATTEIGPDSGAGDCRIAASGGGSADYLGRNYRAFVNDPTNAIDWVPLTTVVPARGPGATDFGIECNETYGGIQYDFQTVSAVALSPG